MKKTYIIPKMSVMQMAQESPLAGSGVKSISNGVDIGYGGVDEDGALDANVKANNFDLEWE